MRFACERLFLTAQRGTLGSSSEHKPSEAMKLRLTIFAAREHGADNKLPANKTTTTTPRARQAAGQGPCIVRRTLDGDACCPSRLLSSGHR